MSKLSAALESGIVHHRAGRLGDAERVYRQVLGAEPNNAEAHHLLGMIALATGHPIDAVASLTIAAGQRPDSAAFRLHLATAYRAAGRAAEAIGPLREALRLDPTSAVANNELGNALRDVGDVAAAELSFRAALRHDPALAAAHNNLGNALKGQGRLTEAVAALSEAVRLRPDVPEIQLNLGNCYRSLNDPAAAAAAYRAALALRPNLVLAHLYLGAVLHGERRYSEAEAAFRREIALKPEQAAAHYSLGVTLQSQHRYDDALACYREALRYKPDDPETCGALGAAYSALADLPQAVVWFRKAHEIAPDNATAVLNLAAALQALGDVDAARAVCEQFARRAPQDPQAHYYLGRALQASGAVADAIAAYRRAIALSPEHAEAHYYYGTTLLSLGRLDEAWDEYEWRLRTPRGPGGCPLPRWNGEPLAGRRILVRAEWGLGDTLHFMRYLPLVERGGGQVVFAVQPALVPLLAQLGLEEVIPAGQPPQPPCDLEVPLLSFPKVFNTCQETIPRDVPYLAVDPQRVETWRIQLSEIGGFRVGICWCGSKAAALDGRRIELVRFAQLAAVPGVRLISLQKGDGVEEIERLGGQFPLLNFGDRLDAGGAFVDTAAVMKNIDLVITVDSAPAHLAGALGVPVWLALSSAPEWRWMRGRADSPWYPTMRLFRQARMHDWTEPFRQMAEALEAIAQRGSGET